MTDPWTNLPPGCRERDLDRPPSLRYGATSDDDDEQEQEREERYAQENER